MVLVGKPERKRPVGGPQHRLGDDNKMDLGEISWGGMDQIHLAQDGGQVVVSVEHCNERSGSRLGDS
jgi:hypothetical protein